MGSMSKLSRLIQWKSLHANSFLYTGMIRLPVNLSAVSSARGGKIYSAYSIANNNWHFLLAAYKVYQIIDRVPEIDIDATTGLTPDKVVGAIEFKNVHFKYPTRPDLTILQDLSLSIKPGMTVAFVVSVHWLFMPKSKHIVTPYSLARDPQALANQPLFSSCNASTMPWLAKSCWMATMSRISMLNGFVNKLV